MQYAPSSSSTTAVSPGTKEYLPDLLARARAAHPDLPLDAVILQSLLICLIAQTRSPAVSEKQAQERAVRPGLHLILRSREEDVGLVVNLAALTLQHVLGVSTHKHKIVPRNNLPPNQRRRPNGVQPSGRSTAGEDTDAFLRSLFFRRAHHPSLSSQRSSTPRPRSGISLDATPRSGTIPLAGQSQAKSPRTTGHAPHRSASYPAVSISDGEDEEQYVDASSLASSRRPLLSAHAAASTVRSRGSSKGRPSAHRLRTDPLPMSALFAPPGIPTQPEPQVPPISVTTSPESMRPQRSGPASDRQNEAGPGQPITALPKAVVVSGLEHTAVPAQRALMRVLTERRLTMETAGDDDDDGRTALAFDDDDDDDGTWNLPEGFIMVYVCKWDPHERPGILRGLLDKFSMSADIALAPTIRQSYLAFRAAHTPTPRGTPVPSPLALPHSIHSSFFPNPSSARHSPIRRNTPLPTPTPQNPPFISASELAYLRTLARPYPTTGPIFYPSIHATVAALQVSPLPGRPPPCAILHPSLDMYLLDLFTATRHHPALDGTLLTQRAHADAEALARAFRVLNGDTVGATLIAHEANIGDKEAATAASFDDESWTEDGWRSAESLAESVRANGFAKRNLPDGYGGGEGVRLRVNEERSDTSGRRSGGFDDLASLEDDLSPHEAQAEAMARAWPEFWDVSEEDVARIFPRVVSHRLRVRNGPDDEVLSSVMWPAAASEGDAAAAAACGMDDSPELGGPESVFAVEWDRKTVKEILVRILADV